MEERKGEYVRVRFNCSVDNAGGFGAIDASQRRALCPDGCPRQGKEVIVFTSTYGKSGTNEEIAEKIRRVLGRCPTCDLPLGQYDFWYAKTLPIDFQSGLEVID